MVSKQKRGPFTDKFVAVHRLSGGVRAALSDGSSDGSPIVFASRVEARAYVGSMHVVPYGTALRKGWIS